MSIVKLLLLAVPVLFALIHLVEFSSYLSRVAGIRGESALTGYSIQQIAFVFTRFFFVAMMPMIGFIIDSKIDREVYLWMVHASLAGATLMYLSAFAGLERITEAFQGVVGRYSTGHGILRSLVGFRTSRTSRSKADPMLRELLRGLSESAEIRRLVFLSSVVFCSYAIAVFLAFFAALNFYDYRSAIGQLSGVLNAAATVVLSFVIEPRLARTIDASESAAETMVVAILAGRLLGVGLLGQLIVLTMWIAL